MYPVRYIQYFNLPVIPDSILKSLNFNFDEYIKKENVENHYWWSDSFNKEINEWGQANICPDMYFAFQAAYGDMGKHKDHNTKTKINFLISTGGSNVLTEFWSDDQETKLASYCIEPMRWHIFKSDTTHSVTNTEPGKLRFGITGRIFS
jgi:hypothetical protein